MNTSMLFLGLFLIAQVVAEEPTPAVDRAENPPFGEGTSDGYHGRPDVAGDAEAPRTELPDDRYESLPDPTAKPDAPIPTNRPGRIAPTADEGVPRVRSFGGAPPTEVDPQTEPSGDPKRTKKTAPKAWTKGDPNKTVAADTIDRVRPADLVRQASAAPATGALAGRAMTLQESLSHRSDRQGQIELTHAYWKLFAATGAFHFAVDEQNRLKAVAASAQIGDAALLRSAQAAAEAYTLESKAVAIAAQHELADLLLRPSETELPLAVDFPHAGSYVTRFDELFSGRTPPKRARAIDETLPLIRRAIDQRTRAVTAATGAVDDAWTAYERNAGSLATLLSRLTHLSLQRRAFLVDVRAYNDDIADYALGSAPIGTAGPELVAMLIRTQSVPELAPKRPIEPSVEKSPESPERPAATPTRDGFIRRD